MLDLNVFAIIDNILDLSHHVLVLGPTGGIAIEYSESEPQFAHHTISLRNQSLYASDVYHSDFSASRICPIPYATFI
jgi:hypothetical protein